MNVHGRARTVQVVVVHRDVGRERLLHPGTFARINAADLYCWFAAFPLDMQRSADVSRELHDSTTYASAIETRFPELPRRVRALFATGLVSVGVFFLSV